MRKDKAGRRYQTAGKLLVSGSLAYDWIMNFPGEFGQHILPTEVHNLNISFYLNSLKRSDGGTAGNIAYSLALLGEKPMVLGVVGEDFAVYGRRLAALGVNVRAVKTVTGVRTAAAYIITDQQDNQIAAFYPGPLPSSYADWALRSVKKIRLAIIAADDKKRMLQYAAAYQNLACPYIFDAGQALIAFSASELRFCLKAADIFIGNDYEIKWTGNKLGLNLSGLNHLVKNIIITKGARGSEIYQSGKKTIVKAARPKNSSDPTGAGDAYRAGLIKGLLSGYDLKTCAQMGAVAAVYTVEKAGTQTHSFNWVEFQRRYRADFGPLAGLK